MIIRVIRVFTAAFPRRVFGKRDRRTKAFHTRLRTEKKAETMCKAIGVHCVHRSLVRLRREGGDDFFEARLAAQGIPERH